MAILARPKDQQQYDRLVGMTQPSATPSKRIGTEVPVGAMSAGTKANQTPESFTKTNATSPGNVFKRQVEGADISGITNLARQPLVRQAADETARIGREGSTYDNVLSGVMSGADQFSDPTAAVKNVMSGDDKTLTTAANIFERKEIETPTLNIGDVKEFTPLQALRGGTVEGLLKSEAKGPYTTGMAGLDALLFNKKGGAAQLAQEGLMTRGSLQAVADKMETDKTQAAKTQAAKFVTDQKEALKNALQTQSDTMREDYDKRLQGKVQKQKNEAAAQTKENVIKMVLDDLKFANPGERAEVEKALKMAQVNFDLQGGPGLLSDVASADEATQYGRLLTLLNQGGVDTKSLGLGQKGSAPTYAALDANAFRTGTNRTNAAAFQAMVEAALNAQRAYRSGSPTSYGPQEPTYGGGGYADNPFAGQRNTTGAPTVFNEDDLNGRGRYA
jgi:hypothetical protein